MLMLRHGYEAKLPLVRSVIAELEASHGVKTISLVGFCFGGKVATLAGGDPLIIPSVRSIVIAHPAPTPASAFAALRVPLLLLHAELDNMFTASHRKAAAAEMEKIKAEGFAFEVADFEGVKHGFANRGDATEEKSLEAMRSAFAKSLDWIGKHTKA
ncbi:Alpha/Beta hydrolase protein [Blyttiomyces helicus]|uniref:Alpha/Beta hydrolase protein n=1 Tax=Blyttiomyces helicus TaxID=388810 RepID=A0A4P9VTS2_9FUNG|nr:Alpha/Beta hydrolase protein [Blyttiomyces helicus]|eukprot:RKO82941.1 Alpha/Beta hydrolase protein [Blyttiomyces helicus]